MAGAGGGGTHVVAVGVAKDGSAGADGRRGSAGQGASEVLTLEVQCNTCCAECYCTACGHRFACGDRARPSHFFCVCLVRQGGGVAAQQQKRHV